MDNYEFCARFAAAQSPGRTATILDYGCGAGQVVQRLREQGFDAYGCDVFFDGGSYALNVPPELFGTIVKRMKSGVIPFECDRFDIVINNQVMEHVADLEAVLNEIHRVLKPGGTVISLFPHMEVWREAHSGVPLLHRFPKGSKLRVYYAAFLSLFGIGHRKGRPRFDWSRYVTQWLDDWTHHRRWREIERAYCARFEQLSRLESDWLRARLGQRPIPRWLARFVALKFAGVVFSCRKALHSS